MIAQLMEMGASGWVALAALAIAAIIPLFFLVLGVAWLAMHFGDDNRRGG